MMRLILLSVICAAQFSGIAQCVLNSYALPGDTVLCGEQVRIKVNAASIGQIIQFENFNSGVGSGWTTSLINYSNPHNSGVDNTPYAWLGDSSSVPRYVQSPPSDLSLAAGVTVCFDLIYASQSGGQSGGLDGPDEPDEGVYLQYSIDGINWVTMNYFDPNWGSDPLLVNWNNWCFQLPPAAYSTQTQFRVFQDNDSGVGYDQWGMDNFRVFMGDPGYTITWPDGYSPGVGIYDTFNVVPYQFNGDTTLIMSMTNGVFSCFDTLHIKVLEPALQAFAGNDTFLTGGACAELNGFAQNILIPASNKTFSMTESRLIGLVSDFEIAVNDLIIDSLKNGQFFSLCFDSFHLLTNDFPKLEVSLLTPDWQEVLVFSADSAFYGNSICFSDIASAGFPGGDSITGNYLPVQSFQNLSGSPASGIWTLKLRVNFLFPVVPLIGMLKGVHLTFSDDSLTGNYTFSWSPTTNMSNSNTLNPTVCPTGTQEQYILTVQDEFGCSVTTDTVNIFSDGNSLVWPGDANADLVANNYDFLPLGLYYGMSGYPRDSISNMWVGHNSLNWNDSRGYFLKQADCNGDGSINDSDTLAIHLNYGLTHPRAGGAEWKVGEPVFILTPEKTSYIPGDTVVLDILVGDSDIPVDSLLGVAFNLILDQSVIEPGSAHLLFTNSFMGNVAGMLKFKRVVEVNGTVDAALTQKDHSGATGYGKIGELRFIANSSITTLVTTRVLVSDYAAIDREGNPIMLDLGNPVDFQINGLNIGMQHSPSPEVSLRVYPNPFNDNTTISYALPSASYVQLRITDALGRVLMETPERFEQAGNHELLYSSGDFSGLLMVQLSVNNIRMIKMLIAQ